MDNLNINNLHITEQTEQTKQTVTNKRVFTCCLCENGKSHNLRACTEFKGRKEGITKNDYYLCNTTTINPNDEFGFCAAGIIPYAIVDSNIYIMLLIETRNQITGLNFIAGGREVVELTENNKIVIRPESSYETALNECREELGEILITESHSKIMNELETKTPTTVLWLRHSKMVLYTIQVNNSLINDIVFETNKSNTTEADGFIWIKLSDYNKYIHRPSETKANDIKTEETKTDETKTDETKANETKPMYFHRFIKNIIYDIKNLSSDGKSLNYLFTI